MFTLLTYHTFPAAQNPPSMTGASIGQGRKAMTDERIPVIVEKSGAIATLTLNDPPHNPVSQDTVEALTAAVQELGADTETRALIIRGAGERAFSAGANIKEFGKGMGAGGLEGNLRARHAMIEAIERSPKPVIAAIHGTCMGGGLEIALGCHFRFASALATFALPEINLGVLPAWSGTQRLAPVVGREAALEMMLRAERWNAERALAHGLVSRVYPRELLLPKAEAFAASLADKPPIAVAAILEATITGEREGFDAGLAAEMRGVQAATGSKDNLEGIAAFLQKRKPRFQGK